MTKLNWESARLRDRIRQEQAATPPPVPMTPAPAAADPASPHPGLAAMAARIDAARSLDQMLVTIKIWRAEIMFLNLFSDAIHGGSGLIAPDYALSLEDRRHADRIAGALDGLQQAAETLGKALATVRR